MSLNEAAASTLSAASYESEVALTIPYHSHLLELAVSVALAAVPTPRRWLDTGCGPGRLTELARARVPAAAHVFADPSPAMLALARARNPDAADGECVCAPTDALPDLGSFDVITALQCHHYHSPLDDPGGRERSLRRCFALLAPGGVLVASENVRAETARGHAAQRTRWAAWQAAQGRVPDVVAAQLAREGTAFHPLPVSAHMALLARVGFVDVELVWRAYGQAAWSARRPDPPAALWRE